LTVLKKYFKRGDDRGFTLVELLIVIGLLGAIALIVIAAINPIEQANRARDTRFKADGAQLISAIDRYFAVRSEFPWVTSGFAADNDAIYGFITASDEGIGICGADCNTDGSLITNDELKPEFRNRDFAQKGGGGDETKKMYIGKASGTSESVYVCFIPMSKATRQKSCSEDNVYTILGVARTVVPEASCSDTSQNWVTNAWYVCIPE